MVAYENGNLDLLENLLRSYSLKEALNQKNKRGDNLLLRAIKDQNESLIRTLISNPNIDITVCDEVNKIIWSIYELE